jgi:mono/diheme cytochrome c family protein
MRSPSWPASVVVAVAVASAVVLVPAVHAAEVRFTRDGNEVKRVDVGALRATCGEQTVTVTDPNYDGATKRYRACPLVDVLRAGFGAAPAPAADVVFHATDGYAKPTSGSVVATAGGWVAFADADLPSGFAPVSPRQVDPGPFYVVWSEPGQDDDHVWPWPYAVESVDITDVTKRWPHIVPQDVEVGSAAWRGFQVFRRECVACHAINREGGTVGPDLNVPQSVVEYRPVEQLKAYIRSPQTFRYGNMPSHENLTDADMEGLIAYFNVMRTQKYDPTPKPDDDEGRHRRHGPGAQP